MRISVACFRVDLKRGLLQHNKICRSPAMPSRTKEGWRDGGGGLKKRAWRGKDGQKTGDGGRIKSVDEWKLSWEGVGDFRKHFSRYTYLVFHNDAMVCVLRD